jgi:hypothetical protein
MRTGLLPDGKFYHIENNFYLINIIPHPVNITLLVNRKLRD